MRWLKFSCFELLRSLELFAGPSSDHDFVECFQANDFSLVHWRLRIPGLHFFVASAGANQTTHRSRSVTRTYYCCCCLCINL